MTDSLASGSAPSIPNDVRTAHTKAKVFEAAVSCLNTFGYAGTTMLKVAREAGVTRGAVQHVYGDRRVDLMSAVAMELYDSYASRFDPLTENGEGPRKLLEQIWVLNSELFKSAETTALVELWLAMRGDEELRKLLQPFFLKRDKQLSKRWQREFAGSGLSAHQIQVIRYSQRALLRGLAIERLLHPDDDVLDGVIEMVKEVTVGWIDEETAGR